MTLFPLRAYRARRVFSKRVQLAGLVHHPHNTEFHRYISESIVESRQQRLQKLHRTTIPVSASYSCVTIRTLSKSCSVQQQ